MANPRVTHNRVGTKKKEEKCSIPIPPNPIIQHPKGTKPPTSYIGKENHQQWNNDLRYSRIEKLEVKDLSLNLGNPTEQCLHEVENSPFKKPTGTY